MRRRHPFLSPTGIVLTAILLVILALLLWRTEGRMFNPGPLSGVSKGQALLGGVSSHAEISDCSQCHQPLETRQSELCMECHIEIRQQLDTGGLHADIPSVENCFECHPDHQGQDFDLVLPAGAKFDHNITRFSLIRHQINYNASPMVCTDCHQDGDYELDDAACTACHANEDQDFMLQHLVEFDTQCLDCHDGIDRMTDFDHHATGFPLDGEHAGLSCGNCHQGTPFDSTPSQCAGCHSEPQLHQNLFGSDCGACHSTTGWVPANLDGLAFDHAADTGFDLNNHMVGFDGSALSCTSCHIEGLQQFAIQTCVDCHSTVELEFMIVHQAQVGVNCLACHDGVDRMVGFEHNSVFLLDGRHAEIECIACHIDFQFVGTPAECSACHEEPEIHAGVFGTACEACHSTTAWAPASLRTHTFPLDHGDEGVLDCLTCHPSTYIEFTCDECHQPAEMLEEHNDEDIFDIAGRCAECHPTGLEEED